MDQPQADYFLMMARETPRDSKIILCGAEPGWLYTGTNSKSWDITDYAISIAENADRGLSVPVKAAIDGRLPHGMGVRRLRDLPSDWRRQSEMLGL
jgi:hypothetical protein